MQKRHRLLWTLMVGLLLASSFSPRPVGAEAIDDTGLWLALFANGKLNPQEEESPWRWWYDGHVRWFDDFDGFGQTIVRPGVGYKVSERATLWAGYAWIHTEPAAPSPFDEHRAWQQLTWGHNFEPTTLDLRSRLEERFMESGSDTGWRFRQMAALRHPLAADLRITLVAWDEVFFHLNDTDWGSKSGFDQNRAFVGFGWKPHAEASWRVEIGYLNQYIDRAGGLDVSNHLLSMNLFWNP